MERKLAAYTFYVDIYITKIKLIKPSLNGAELCIKVHDMEPVYLGELISKSHGRATIDFNKGIRLYLQMSMKKPPSKLPIILIADSDGIQYAGGVNAVELFNESIRFKQPSSIAKEHSKLLSNMGRDAALVSFKLRIEVEKLPVVVNREKINPVVNARSTDLLRTNAQYRQICKDLTSQVTSLEAQVDKIIGNQRGPTQIRFPRTTVKNYQDTYNTNTVKFSLQNSVPGGRTKPTFDMRFEDETSEGGNNDYTSNSSASIVDAGSDYSAPNNSDDSVDSVDSVVDDESFSSDSSIEYNKTSSGSIDDVYNSVPSSDEKKSKVSSKKSKNYSSSVSFDDSKSAKRKSSSSNSFKSFGSSSKGKKSSSKKDYNSSNAGFASESSDRSFSAVSVAESSSSFKSNSKKSNKKEDKSNSSSSDLSKFDGSGSESHGKESSGSNKFISDSFDESKVPSKKKSSGSGKSDPFADLDESF